MTANCRTNLIALAGTDHCTDIATEAKTQAATFGEPIREIRR